MYKELSAKTLIIAAAFCLLIACNEKKNESASTPRPVKAIQIGDSKSFSNRAFPGRARAAKEVDLAFNVSGALVELPINIGDKVKKDTLIAKLDPREFEAKLKSAKAEVTRDEQNYLRAKELVGKGHISKSDYDLIQAKLSISEANMDLAEKALADSVIKAPFNGQIANLYVENFQTVASKQIIARLLDISQIEMVIQIPETSISLISHTKDLLVQFDSFPNHPIPARIKEVSNEASPDTRTYPVTLIMQQPKDFEILPGMAGKVTGKLQQADNLQNKLTVPASALLTMDADNKNYVWVINQNKAHLQQVTIGELTPTGVSILSGLAPGDWVITAGVHSLKEGEPVALLNQQDN
ncbi:Macrolide-specific efflux protein MacA precursor [Legionella massiliensis]|uniref:Macrolide-specific efflux protein MacA n=1 Tax=Legionella massiliensis TaxID=1034943 RepID=A0A078L1C1_9GAMM|nr:efflux RND transporter periplasmic adaptor subunit [Legionella massiliensis]CDZ78981.1 Macrolide-specific efflux protein MacA precursor [Legionella massiliensis]CEE14719.1 Macrolide export protein MacA [Legionella massiliensis]